MRHSRKRNKKFRGGSTKIIREGNNKLTVNNLCDGDNSTTIIPECMAPMVAEPVLAPASAPAPISQTYPEPAPSPSPSPYAAPHPSPEPAETQEPSPAPQPAPKPEEAPQPEPQPAPQPAPEPAPEPSPQPEPAPQPSPQPEPAPQPSPQPAPAPAPAPVPAPQPIPSPPPTGPVILSLNFYRPSPVYNYDKANKKLYSIEFITADTNINNFNINDTVNVTNIYGLFYANDYSYLPMGNYLIGPAKILRKYPVSISETAIELGYDPPIENLDLNYNIGIPYLIFYDINGIHGTITKEIIYEPSIEVSTSIPSTITSIIGGNKIAGFSGDGNNALQASLNKPYGIIYDQNKNLYIADTLNHRIRKITNTGIISTIAGNGNQGYSGDNGSALLASFNYPTDLLLNDNNLYILDSNNNAIRVIDLTTNIINTFINNSSIPSPDFFQPQSFCLDLTKLYIYIANTFKNKIIKIHIITKVIYNVAGTGTLGLVDNVNAISCRLNTPYGICIDNYNNIYIADTRNHRIRFINFTNTVINTICGIGLAGFSGDNGSPLNAKLFSPTSIVIDKNFNVIFSDSGNNRIRKIFINKRPNSTNLVNLSSFESMYFNLNTIAGTGTISYTPNGLDARQISINNPTKLLFDDNNLIFSDTNNNVIRKITPLILGGKRKYKRKNLHTRSKKRHQKKSNQKKSQQMK